MLAKISLIITALDTKSRTGVWRRDRQRAQASLIEWSCGESGIGKEKATETAGLWYAVVIGIWD